MGKKIIWIILSLVIIIPVIRPLFTSYIPGTADGLAHKFRLVAFDREIRDGNLRPRWLNSQNLGYGSPIFLYNYLLPYYSIDFIYRFGLTVNLSTQIYEAVTLILSFIFMYLLANHLWGRKAGLAAASIYTWAPYHLMTVYLYEGWGEMGAFVFPPLLLYLIIQFNKAKSIFCFLLYVICYLLFILTHNVSVLIFTPVIILAGLVLSKTRKVFLLFVLGGFAAACLMSSFFSLPAIMSNSQIKYQRLLNYEASVRGQYLTSIITLVINSVQTLRNGIAHFKEFSLGFPLSFVAIISLFYVFQMIIMTIKRKKWTDDYKLFSIIILFFFSALLLTHPVSERLWKTGFLNIIVYPFRFFSVVVLCGSIIAGFTARKSIYISTALIILAVISGFPYTRPYVDMFPFGNSYFQEPQTIKLAPETRKNMAAAEFLPKWVTEEAVNKIENQYLYTKIIDSKFEIEDTAGKVIETSIKGDRQLSHITLNDRAKVRVNTFYFPNWEAYLDNSKVKIDREVDGLMSVTVPKGTHKLEMVFGYSLVERIGIILSVIGAVMLFIEMFLLKKLYESQK